MTVDVPGDHRGPGAVCGPIQPYLSCWDRCNFSTADTDFSVSKASTVLHIQPFFFALFDIL